MERRLDPDPELEALVQDLNSRAQETAAARRSFDGSIDGNEPSDPGTTPASAPRRQRAPAWSLPQPDRVGIERLEALLQSARDRNASDLLLVQDHPPTIRIDGALIPLEQAALRQGEAAMLCAALVPVPRRDQLCRDGAVDFSIHPDGLGRFRCNVHRQRSAWSAAVRLLGSARPTLESLSLPGDLASYAKLERGLVLVTGPTGSGKSTTLAALIRRILQHRNVHLITVEDPVEYEHHHERSVVEHIEVGRDVESFPAALRSAVRQDPDVLLIGEMRDTESMSMAISAAETGHLVLSTLHTGNAPQAIHRIIDSFPPNQQDQIRAQISISLAGVISQQLLPRSDGNGRVPAVENLVATHAVRNLIRRNKVQILRAQIALERAEGMISFDESLASLVKRGLVDKAEARQRAIDLKEFDRLV